MEQVGEWPKTRRGQLTKDEVKAAIEKAVVPIIEEISMLPNIDAINMMLGNLGKVIELK